jgi:hypothetical protein
VWVFVGVQAFRIIDPKGVMLEALSGPVKEVRIRVWCSLRCYPLTLGNVLHAVPQAAEGHGAMHRPEPHG